MKPSTHAMNQYATTTANLTARIALHAYGTNPRTWFEWLDERLPRDGAILEIGAGTGELWSHVDPTDLDLTLTDFSPAMCERLRAVPGARVEQCEATNLPFAAGSFDTVIANHMLYHVDDPDAALREFARVLRPGGRVAIATNGRDHLAELNELSVAIGRPDLVLRKHQNGFTAEDGPSIVAGHFTDVRVDAYPCDLAVGAPEPVLAFLASMTDDALTPQQIDAARALVEASITQDGHYRISKHTVLITASR